MFETGKSLYAPPLRIIYQLKDAGPYPVAMAVSVPKRLFKRAVDRNLLKRKIREAYRLNKRSLYVLLKQKNKTLHILIQYQQREISDYKTIEEGVLTGMAKLERILQPREQVSG